MKEYKIVGADMNREKTERKLGELVNEGGWNVIGFTDHQILLERVLVEQELLTEG